MFGNHNYESNDNVQECSENAGSIILTKFDPTRFACIKFIRANRNAPIAIADHSIIRITKRPLLADTERIYYISYYIILAWSISWGQLDNSSIRLLTFESVMPAYTRWIGESPGAVALFVTCRFSLILLRLSFSLGKSRRRDAKTLSREDGTDWGARPSDKRVINTSFVSKLEAPRVSQPFVKLPRFSTLSIANHPFLSCLAIMNARK